ncbi:cytochrome c oxidase assembly protein COX16 homolog, mitochondrial-like [Varroa jacobsoni]|uniref:Cytochrome c oxidase assembly protein COX16 homolog, mitochondrial n=1 Tax=Varroa destructor TaxID=109461 RepID=A0A7M7KAL4_VARDE|nr:cytochrome c oxidase assembly protein COX16 homolog, mitochondrial-like [Varroa destructor]XP_022685864.1 cytochrome c oxidase assembly protein COX16 homolog, mitochondrial-like [Varroa jacobsoni]
MMQILLRIKQAYSQQGRFIRFGTPFGLFMIGGLLGLKEFTSLRYEVSSTKKLTKEEWAKYGLKKKDEGETNIDIIYETDIKKMDTDSWENVRGPRPWENDGTFMEKMKEKARKDRELQKARRQQLQSGA